MAGGTAGVIAPIVHGLASDTDGAATVGAAAPGAEMDMATAPAESSCVATAGTVAAAGVPSDNLSSGGAGLSSLRRHYSADDPWVVCSPRAAPSDALHDDVLAVSPEAGLVLATCVPA